MRLLTAGLQVRVLLAEPIDTPHSQQEWGVLSLEVGPIVGLDDRGEIEDP